MITTEGKIHAFALLGGAALAAFVLFIVGRLAWGEGWIYVAWPGLWGSPWVLALCKLAALLVLARVFVVAQWYGRRVRLGLLLGVGVIAYQMLEAITYPPGPNMTTYELLHLAAVTALAWGADGRGLTRARAALRLERLERGP